MRAIARLLLACACFAVLLASACTRSNNLLLGRVQATAGTGAVVVDHGVVSISGAPGGRSVHSRD